MSPRICHYVSGLPSSRGMVAVSVAEKFRKVILLKIGTYHTDPAGVIGGMISDLGFLRYHVEFEPAAVGGGYYALGTENCSEVVVHAEKLEYVFDLCTAESAYSLDAPAVEYLIRMMMTVMVVTAAAVFVMAVVMVLVMFMVMIMMVMTAAAVLVMAVVMVLVMFMVMIVMVVTAAAVLVMVVVMVLVMFMVMIVVVVTAATVLVMVVVMVLVMLMVVIVMIVAAAAVFIVIVVMMFVMLMVVFMHRQCLVFQRASDGVA